MPDDISRRRWTDDRIDDVANEVRALRDIPLELAKTTVRQEGTQGELEDFKAWIGEKLTGLDKKISDLDKKIDGVEQRIIKRSRATFLAVLAFAAPVTAAVIAGVVTLITHFA